MLILILILILLPLFNEFRNFLVHVFLVGNFTHGKEILGRENVIHASRRHLADKHNIIFL